MLLISSACFSSCTKDLNTRPAEQTLLQNEKATTPLISTLGNYWNQLTVPDLNLATSFMFNLSFSVNNKVYVEILANDQLWEYDPATAIWAVKKNNFIGQTGFSYVNFFTNGTQVYFGNLTTKVMKAYDFSTGLWTNKANFPGTAVGGATFAASSSKGYIMSGYSGTGSDGYNLAVNQNWEYDFAADSWLQKVNTPGFSRYNANSYAIGDKIYYGTGTSIFTIINPVTFQITHNPIIDSDWWEFNTLTNTWAQKAAFGGGARQDTRGFAVNNKIYLGLGSSGYYTNMKSDLWSYDAGSDTWAQKASYPPGNGYPPYLTMTACSGRGYAVTENLSAFWGYTPPLVLLPTGN